MSQLYDITIVGGGPLASLLPFTPTYAKPKSKSSTLFPSSVVSLPSFILRSKSWCARFSKLNWEELTNRLIEQLNCFETPVHLNETVLEIEKQDQGFAITTNKGSHLTKTVIIAMGGGAFKTTAARIGERWGLWKYPLPRFNIQQYAGKKVTILGGGDSAVDWALAFEKIAPTTLVHRRDNFRALEHSVQALQESSVTIKTPFVPSQLIGDGKNTRQTRNHQSQKQMKPKLSK